MQRIHNIIMESQHNNIMQTQHNSVEVLDKYEQIEIDITNAVEEYISRLDSPEKIEQVSTFNGLIMFINSTVVRRLTDEHEQAVTSDITMLSLLWDIYTSLCATYNKTITAVQYSVLVGIHNTTINKWLHGYTRGITKQHTELAKKIMLACESNVVGNIVDKNSIGSIFYSKAVFGYSDTQTQVIEIRNGAERTAAEIAAQYADIIPQKNTPVAELSDNLTAAKQAENSGVS